MNYKITPRILIVKIVDGYRAKCIDFDTLTVDRASPIDAVRACVTHIFNDAVNDQLELTPCNKADLMDWCCGEPDNLDLRFNVYSGHDWQFEGFSVRYNDENQNLPCGV